MTDYAARLPNNRPPTTDHRHATSFCTFVAHPCATRTTGMHSLARQADAMARIRRRTPAREYVALLQNRHGAARGALHPPDPGQSTSASGNA
jgi:hypothetical protein